jgi:UDP-N-acetylglucosamine 3-dehydrogenase
MGEKLRVALIGAGTMGRNHARVYSEMEDVAFVGVADANIASAQIVARKFGAEPFADFVEMLEAQRPHAVSVAVPTVMHLPVAREVIKRGISLLVEKPIAHTLEEGMELIKLAQDAGVTLAIGHVERFNPAVIALKARLRYGELGRVFQIDARRQGPFPARVQDVGVVIDLAVHDLDVIRYVTDSEILRVYAETERNIAANEDTLSALLRLNNGAIGTVEINWLTPTKIRELQVIGERGMFRVDYLTQDLYFYENGVTVSPDWDALRNLRGVSEGSMTRLALAKKEPLRAELEGFVERVRGGAGSIVSGEDGLAALQLALAVLHSGNASRPVEFPLANVAKPAQRRAYASMTTL